MIFYIIIVLLIILFYLVFRKDTKGKVNKIFGHEKGNDIDRLIKKSLAISMVEPSAEIYYSIGNMYKYNSNQPEKAITYYKKAVDETIKKPEKNKRMANLLVYNDVVPQAQKREIIDKVSNAIKSTSPKEKVFKEKAIVANDAQNVHDTYLNKTLKDKYEFIKNTPTRDDLSQIRKYINDCDLDGAKKSRAFATLEKIEKGGTISVIGDDEKNVLVSVWNRAYLDDNNEADIKNSVVNSLIDSTNDSNYTVCAMGRTSRIITSLDIIDKNEKISEPIMTKDMVNNEAMYKAYQILSDELKDDEQNALYMENKNEGLVNRVKTKIREEFTKSYSNLDPESLETLILNAQSGI